MPTIDDVTVEAVRIPFVATFSHSGATRAESASVVARVHMGPTVGIGEGAPRRYVTGEDLEACEATVSRRGRELVGARVDTPDDVLPLVEGLPPAARSALEIALLDALAAATGRTLAALLGTPRYADVRYSMVFSTGSLPAVEALARRAAALGFAHAKVKVGPDADHDEAVVRCVRDHLGPRVQLRADANGAWRPDEAPARCRRLAELGVWVVEDPLAVADQAHLPALARALPEGTSILIDDALVGLDDAERLLDAGGVHRLLLKVSKHGGLGPSLAIARLAEARGVPVHLGSHVGETSVLAAAGRTLAALVPFETAEGSWGPLLLTRDVVAPVTFGPGGHAPTHLGPSGLGVHP